MTKPAENRFQQAQTAWPLILDNVYDAVVLIDSEKRLVLFNERLVKIWNLDQRWLAQKPTLEEIFSRLVAQNLWLPEQCDALMTACCAPSAQNRVIEITQQNQTYLEISLTATSDGGQLVIVRDVSVQRSYQEQLADEVRRLSFLLGLTERLQSTDNLHDVSEFALRYLVEAMGAAFGDVKVVTGEGKNRRAGAVSNLISGQFIATYGQPLVDDMEAVLKRGVEFGKGRLWEVVETGRPVFVEDYASHPKAVKGFCHPSIGQLGIFPIPSADGSIIGVLTLESRDLNKLQEAPQQDMLLAACQTLGAAIERTQAQARLQQINQDLEQASQMKSQFLTAMSHELRTPLNSILGFSELLLRHRETLEGRQVRYAHTIHQSGEHLLSLINDILDLSKVEAGRVDLEQNTVSIQGLCHECLQMIQPRAQRKRLSLSVEFDYSLDQVTLDRRRTQQMVINLLSNAVKFTPEKGQIKLSTRLAYGSELGADFRPDDSPINASTPYLCIQVSDTGIGIAPDKMSLLFQPFRQIDSALNRSHDGTGLGLALTKRLAELHGGTVSVISIFGEGSTFRVWLPVNELRKGEAAFDRCKLVNSDADSLFKEKTIHSGVRLLVVEDHLYNQALIAEALEAEGFEVELVEDGEVILNTLESNSISKSTLPDAVLMDIQLPNVDGLQLIQAMRASSLWRDLPIIAVTAMAMAGDKERCIAAGANDYVSKPLNFEVLKQRLWQLLEATRDS